jgi:hypothetical protein
VLCLILSYNGEQEASAIMTPTYHACYNKEMVLRRDNLQPRPPVPSVPHLRCPEEYHEVQGRGALVGVQTGVQRGRRLESMEVDVATRVRDI